MRDEILERWVDQPPAGPNVQYVRDAERRAAVEQLGRRSRVLDLASESAVTRGVDADRVVRVDFSPAASAHAADVLGDAVDRYEAADPADPTLPFADDAFDGGVCIGPYDWKFLDVDALTAEAHRVVAPDGRFVFSVPTPRSPYAEWGRDTFRYFTPEAARDLIAPDWRLDDSDLVYQFPYRVHHLVNLLPDRAQEPFVRVERWGTERLTAGDRWDDASYLVLGVGPLDYAGRLDDGLDCLFRSTAEDGFWDDGAGTFVRALDYRYEDGEFAWEPDDRVLWRYAPFALLGAMRWRTSAAGDDRYDPKLRRALSYFGERTSDPDRLGEMPSYGVGPLVAAFGLAADCFDGPHEATARRLFEASRGSSFDHAEDSLLLYGWSVLLDRTGDAAVREAVDDGLWAVSRRYEHPSRQFVFDNATTRRHQNQMYALWGLCRAVEATGRTGYLDTAEAVLDYAVDRRMRDDGAFLWEDPSRVRRLGNAAWRAVTGARPPHWAFLYECHQTFFVNAVAGYYAADGGRDYDSAVRRAMAWIYGENAFGVDTADLSGLGVPVRFVTVDGRLDVPDQRFKGAYEVGSYVMALAALVAGPLARGPDGTRPGER